MKPVPWGAPAYPKPGTVLLGKYRVEALIGEGGMGSVVRALHADLDEHVAIKILLPELVGREEIVKRFMREAKAAAKLKNEHVARVLDVGALDGPFAGRPYIVMEYLEGSDLRAIIKHHGPQDASVAADLLLQACEAIADAHAFGIIHRDIKPSNFFITRPDGVTPLLKVVDFGIATAPPGAADVTSTHSVVGTPAYMAPEQMRNAREANPKSDVWSLGVVLYEMLEARRPWPSDVYSELVLSVGMDPPAPMTRTPEAMRRIVLRCLEKSLDRRYASVAELASDLVPFASDPVSARVSAETCARTLGRRRSGVVQTPLERGDPTSGTPAPLTPRSRLPMPLATPLPRQVPVAVRETPAPPAPRRRWAVVVASFAIACAAGGGGAWWYTQQLASASVTPTVPDTASVEARVDAGTAAVDAAAVAEVADASADGPVAGGGADTTSTVMAEREPASARSDPPAIARPKPKPRRLVVKPKPKPKPKLPDDPFSRR
ncbi:MAG TPA: serine/threonine-protein kinase [Kofleriaceae bacterium]|nr:serine/threonine-protein kinase [Kofleriaceae bacterium]